MLLSDQMLLYRLTLQPVEQLGYGQMRSHLLTFAHQTHRCNFYVLGRKTLHSSGTALLTILC